jgi:hypothetical protein
MTYTVDVSGNPVTSTGRVIATRFCPTGAAVDPVTGDILFTTVYGFPNLNILTGFTVPPLRMKFANDVYRVAENAGNARIRVIRQGDVSQPLEVNYATSAGTAVAGINYTDMSGSLHWNAGDGTSRSFLVPLLDDGVDRPSLTVNLSMTRANGTRAAQSVLAIRDADPAPTVSFTAAQVYSHEGAQGAGVAVRAAKVQLSAASGKRVTVPVSVTSGSPDARVTVSSSVVIPAGQASAYAVVVADDATSQPNLQLGLSLGAPTNATLGAQATTTLTVIDDD